MPRKKAPKEGVKKVNNPSVMSLRSEVLEQPITETLEINYTPYAMSVIVSRAIPEIDGFKPSHRKLLYTMYQMRLLGGARTKSANVVGQTMKLNPRGDTAIYDTVVRLSQGYGALLHPLVGSKGNFGKMYSRDMAWAASRYTEVRLGPICAELFRDISQDTADFVDNYDGSMQEPTPLPATFPNVLVSANQGTAVGMASNLCGFNPGEVCDATVALPKNPQVSLLNHLKAPDLPTGGELPYDEGALRQIYEASRGSFQVRTKWRYLKGENLTEIYGIPYTTTVEAIMDEVAELVKGDRTREIADMRDGTDLNGLKITIDLKWEADPDKLMTRLFRSTTLQDPFSYNFNILIASMPRVMGVREILDEWTGWRMKGVWRRTYFVMREKQDKLHLLRGLKKILLDIDWAIKIIRETEEDDQVVPNLMIGFSIDGVQAEYVADIKLHNINKEYILKRTEEVAGLEEEIADLQDIVNNSGRIKKLIVVELQAVQKKYAVPRRTEIIYEYQTAATEDVEDGTPDYPVHMFCSWEGYFKKITPQSLRMSGEQKYKEGDGPWLQWEASNRDELLVFIDRQQCYKARLSNLDDPKVNLLGDFLPTKLGMNPGEGLVWVCVIVGYSGHLLFFFEDDKVARVALSAYQTQTRRKKLTGAYPDKSPLAAVHLLTGDMEMAVTSAKGRVMVFRTTALTSKTIRSTQGINVMTLKPKYKVADARPLADTIIVSAARYQAYSLSIVGMLLRPGDRAEEQTTLLE